MALSYTTTEGTLIIPGAYPSVKVAAEAGGLSANGIVTLVGEADAGPDRSLEDDLEANAFGVDQVAAVVAKYRSGNLVEAFRAIASPANDVNISGGPSRVIVVKTNVSTKATRNLVNFGATTYGVLGDKSYGRLGNLIQSQLLASQAESLPTTGSFAYIPPVGSVNFECRVNGGAALPVAVTAAMMPDTFVSTVNSLPNIAATGGVNRVAHPTTGNLSATVSGFDITITTIGGAWGATPVAGDTLVIGTASVLAGAGPGGGGNPAGADNVGAYVITVVTPTTITATKKSDANQVGAVVGAPVAPVAVTSVAVGGTPASNLVVYSPAVITLEAGNPSDGIGKTLEIAQLTTGTDLLERAALTLAGAAVTWISKSASPTKINSTAEYIAQLSLSRQADGVSEDLVAGGEVALNIGYSGTTGTLTISSAGVLTTTVGGGSGSGLTITLADFSTVADLAAYISTQTGYTAAVESAVIGQLPSTALDQVSAMGICTSFGAKNGRIKADAYKFFKKINEESALVQLQNVSGTVVRAGAGLPATQAAGFLAGGAKGGTTAANVTAAIDALERVSTNFIVPLFSRDAVGADITDNLTESSSTYTIDGINAALKTHVNKMSTLKRRKHRQAFLSKRTTFALAKEAAANLAAYRCSLSFQDVKLVSGSGVITQYQPWMASVLAAGMQAAGFYRALVNKGVNCSGVLQAARDFDDRDMTQVEQALLAGLLLIARKTTGGFAWVSDQTTYSRDGNFVYNSIQATYAADLVALSTAQRMELTFLGQSVADVSAAIAKATLDSIMTDFARLKLIAASDDAPKGYKNAVVQIAGPVMLVSLEIKLAGAIYFIPISFVVSQVQQSA